MRKVILIATLVLFGVSCGASEDVITHPAETISMEVAK